MAETKSLTVPNLPLVIERIRNAIQKEIRVNQPVSNWASRIGHPCKRFLVYSRLDWDKLPPITPERKMLFDLGHVIEKNVAKVYMEKAGFDIVEMDRPIQSERSGLLRRVKLHGKLDFIARDQSNGFEFPVEVKSASPYSFDDISTVEDFFKSRHVWMRQYPAQLMVYLLGKDYEFGLMLLINKLTAEPKGVWIHQDYTYAEELIKKAEEVNRAVEAGEYPERIPYSEDVCGKCDFAMHCLKDVMRTEAEILTDPDLIEELERRETLKESKSEFEKLDKIVKKKLDGIAKGVAGDFMITGKQQHRDGYAVNAVDYWTTAIKKLGGKP